MFRCHNYFDSLAHVNVYNAEHPGITLKINEFSDHVCISYFI